jgi:hypothetical protein
MKLDFSDDGTIDKYGSHFIQIDHTNETGFAVSCLKTTTEDEATGNFDIMQRFGNCLEESIKFALGAMAAVRLFQHKVYHVPLFFEVIFTPAAMQQIKNHKYRVAEYIYPDLKILKRRW